ncbi:MAG: M48 family metalloprotease [Alphaproteobacteria bacterium]|nr:M48 family metalloprotease [Alphaproteobacteria bacterium]
MKIKQALKRLLGMNRYDVADKFNKAAIVGAPVATGYAMDGLWGAVNSAAVTFFTSFMLLPRMRERYRVHQEQARQSIEQATLAMFSDRLGPVAQEVSRIKEVSGISEKIDVLVVDTDSPVSVNHGDNDVKVLASPNALMSMPTSQFLAVLRHELGHVKHQDNKNYRRLSLVSFAGAVGNIIKGVIQIPFAGPSGLVIALGGGLVQKGLLTFHRKNAEFRADAFSMKHGDPKALLQSFDTIRPDPNSIGLTVLNEYEEFMKNLPSRVSSFLRSRRIPVPVMQWFFALRPFFSGAHPSASAREERMVAQIKKTDPGFEKPAYDVPTEIVICGPCADLTNDVDQYNATFFIREEFKHVHGHDDVRVAFKEECESEQVLPFGLGGVFIVAVRPDSFGEYTQYGLDF